MLRLLSVCITLVISGAIVWHVGPAELWQALSSVPPATAAGIMLMLTVNLVLVLVRLHWTLHHTGVHVPWAVSLRAGATGLVSSLFVFNLFGTILGRHHTLRSYGVSASAVVLVSGYERFVMALVGLVLAALGFHVIFGADAVRSAIERTPLLPAAIVLPLALALSFAIARPQRELDLLRRLVTPSALARASAIAGLTFVANLAVFAAYAAAVRGLAPQVGWEGALAAAAIVTLAASMPLSVNGWGIRELASVYAFGALGVGAAEAVAASVLIGLCSTVVVGFAAPLLLIRPAAPAGQASGDATVAEDGRHFARASALLLGHLSAYFLFFQVQARIADGWISLNLADPLAVLALCLVVVSLAATRTIPLRLPRAFVVWIAALGAILLAAFAHGYFAYGFSDWAFANRLVGGLILLGYIACGAFVCAELGAHGRRRVAETLIVTAVAVLAVYSLERLLLAFEVMDHHMTTNFQGYSGNRNTFSFQILVGLCFAIAYAEARRRARSLAGWTVLAGALVLGLWQTGSIAGLLAGGLVVALAAFFRPALRPFLARMSAVALAFAVAWWAIPTYLAPARSAKVATEKGAIFDPSEVLAGTSTEGRLRSVEVGLDLFMQNPLVGAGLGAVARQGLGLEGSILVVHSTPVWILAEFGLVGAAVVASLPVWLVWRRRMRPPGARETAATAVVLLLAFFGVFSLVHDVAYQRIWWLAIGIVTAAAVRFTQGDRHAAVA